MRVTFDSNVYRGVVNPASSRGHPAAYEAVHKAIRKGRIHGFLSETIVSLEGVPGSDRGDYLASVRPDIRVDVRSGPGGSVAMGLSMRPDNSQFPPLNEILDRWIERAVDLGLRFIRLPRVAMPSPMPDSSVVELEKMSGDGSDVANAISRAIERRGVGIEVLAGIGRRINSRRGTPDDHWSRNLDSPKDGHERGEIVRAVAEWADGDTAAAHGGHCNDLLCTEDRGRSAGRSVFSDDNRAWLTQRFGFTFIGVVGLAERL